MTAVQVELPPKLIPVFEGEAMYRGAYGGRGSGKTRTFAKMAAVKGMILSQAGEHGVIVCGREFMNSLDESSMAEVKAAIASETWLSDYYEVGERFIRTKDKRIEFAFIGLRHNLDSIKSKARILLLWVDEAEPVTETAWMKAIPTVREEQSEIWVTWNPEREESPTHRRFRQDPPQGSKIIEINWADNPWFPDTLNKTRLDDKAKRPEQYGHVWEGEFISVVEGAYFASHLTDAKREKRITRVSKDPQMTLRAFWDIGGTGAKADATAIWIAQFVGREVRVLNYYEAVGQELSVHLAWLRDNGYEKALCVLPHDGAHNEKITDNSFERAISTAGFKVKVIPNQGAGAAKARVEAARRLFPSIWFNEDTTEGGRKALGWYHERIDEQRRIGLGPCHDWSSHGADAFGLMCIAYEAPGGPPIVNTRAKSLARSIV
jgi:phage terminase large subunit